MTKRPISIPSDGIVAGVTVRIKRGLHKGKAGTVATVFRRAVRENSTVMVGDIPSSRWKADVFAIDDVELVGGRAG